MKRLSALLIMGCVVALTSAALVMMEHAAAPKKDPLVKKITEYAIQQNALERISIDGNSMLGLTNTKPIYIKDPIPLPKIIALTFDDGPHPIHTEKILSTLRDEKVHATFFEIGEQVERYPEIAKLVVADGHEIGNHTYAHFFHRNAGWNTITNDLQKTHMLLEEITGTAPTFFRPPYGAVTQPMLYVLQHLFPYPIIVWSVDARDWESRDPDTIVTTVLNNARPGGIVVLHDTYQATSDALPSIITGLKEKGYEFVTISELFQWDEHPEDRINGAFYGKSDLRRWMEDADK